LVRDLRHFALPDITLAKEKLGWAPKISLEEGFMSFDISLSNDLTIV